MSFVLTEKGAIKQWPYAYAELRAAHPDTSFPREPSAELLAEYGVYEVVPTQAGPGPGKIAVESEPVLVKGVWTQKWAEVDAPRRMIPKWLIVERLTDAQLEAAMGMLSLRQSERWRASAFPEIYADDPEMIAVLTAVGADAKAVLA